MPTHARGPMGVACVEGTSHPAATNGADTFDGLRPAITQAHDPAQRAEVGR